MGKMSIILVLAAIMTGGSVMYNMQRTTLGTESVLADQHYQFLAREVAYVGLDVEVKQYIDNNVSSTTAEWPAFLPANNVSYGGGEYDVIGRTKSMCTDTGSCACNEITSASWTTSFGGEPPPNQQLNVTATGTYSNASEVVHHEVNVCYVIVPFSLGSPPLFEYAFYSGGDFAMNGGPEIQAIEGQGNVHSDGTMVLGPNAVIVGHATYSEETGSSQHDRTQTSSFGVGPVQSLPSFDPYNAELLAIAQSEGHRYDTESPSISGTVTVAPPNWPNTTVGEPNNPFYWYIDGNLTLGGTTHVILPAYTIIVVTGTMTVSGTAAITHSTQKSPDNNSNEAIMDWIEANTDQDGKNVIAFYVNDDVTFNGTGNIVGNIFTNGDFEMNGGGNGTNIVGSVTAVGDVTVNGGGNGNNFWYTAAADEVMIPGMDIPATRVSVVSLTEWKHEVIDHSGGPVN